MNSEKEKYVENSNEDKDYLTTETFEEDTNEYQVDISDDFYEYLGDPGEENKTAQSSTTSKSEDYEDGAFLGALGLNSLKLTPEEISSNAVLVEQKLEEYNSSR